MTPQESQLLKDFLAQLEAVRGVPKDAEAEALIKQAAGRQPDALYLLVQRSIMQDQAVEAASARITALEKEVAELKAAGLPTSTALEEVEALILGTGTASRRILEREQYREAIGTLEDLSERNQAVQAQIQARLIAEMTLGERDPGVTWEDVDPDLIVVDEAQNFKNLFAAQEREGGLPKYLGAIQEGSDRAWELAIRTGILRRRNGGGGVMFGIGVSTCSIGAGQHPQSARLEGQGAPGQGRGEQKRRSERRPVVML